MVCLIIEVLLIAISDDVFVNWTMILSYGFWVLANIMTESPFCFWKCDKNPIQGICNANFSPKFWGDCCMLIYTCWRSWWNQWGVMAASHCHWRWRWLILLSDAHKAITALILVLSVLVWLELTQQWPPSCVVEFLCNLIDICSCLYISEGQCIFLVECCHFSVIIIEWMSIVMQTCSSACFGKTYL